MANNEKMNAASPKTGIESPEFEIQYLQEMLGVGEQEIRQAMEVVGNDREQIAQYITACK